MSKPWQNDSFVVSKGTVVVEVLELDVWRKPEGIGAEVEPALLEWHETSCSEESVSENKQTQNKVNVT